MASSDDYNGFTEGEEVVLTYTEAGTDGRNGYDGTSGTERKWGKEPMEPGTNGME